MAGGRMLYPVAGSLSRELVVLSGKVVLGASGAVSSTDCDGFSVSKTGGETGRYTVQLGVSSSQPDLYAKLRGASVSIVGPDDAAMTDAKGLGYVLRDDDVATDGTFEVQFINPETAADAEVQDSASFFITIFLKRV
jgi:hypothetical protein